MKTKLAIALLTMMVVVASYARQTSDATVKILPAKEKGVIKILYAKEIEKWVEVKFFTEEGIIATDEIKGKDHPRGFLKKYDLRRVNLENYWVEITSPDLSVTYKLTGSDNDNVTAQLEKTITTYHHSMVAKRN